MKKEFIKLMIDITNTKNTPLIKLFLFLVSIKTVSGQIIIKNQSRVVIYMPRYLTTVKTIINTNIEKSGITNKCFIYLNALNGTGFW